MLPTNCNFFDFSSVHIWTPEKQEHIPDDDSDDDNVVEEEAEAYVWEIVGTVASTYLTPYV